MSVKLSPARVSTTRSKSLNQLVVPYLLASLAVHPHTRLLMPLFWGLAAFEAFAVSLLPRRWAPAAALLVVLPSLVLSFGELLPSGARAQFLSGRLDRKGFLARALPGFAAAEFVNRLPPGGRVMALDFPGPVYFDRPWIVEGLRNEPPLKLWLQGGADANALLSNLHDLDVRYLVVTPGYGGGTPASLYPLAGSRAQAGALVAFRSHLQLLATIDSVDVYAVPRER